MIILDKSNIRQEILGYLEKVDEITFPERPADNLEYMLLLKRGRIGGGPYPEVSIFEASNRIFSDLIILFGIRQILYNPRIGPVVLPFDHYKVRFGTEDGSDIEAEKGDDRLVGEAFNVAETFFPVKKKKEVRKLKEKDYVNYKMVVFNADAVRNPEMLFQNSEQSMMFLPVDWQKTIAGMQKEEGSFLKD